MLPLFSRCGFSPKSRVKRMSGCDFQLENQGSLQKAKRALQEHLEADVFVTRLPQNCLNQL